MIELGLQNGASPSGRAKPGSAWAVYRRLLGYAWPYKGRLAVSILFAVIVAASSTSMILAVAGVVQVVFGDETEVYQTVAQYAQEFERDGAGATDLAYRTAGRIVTWMPAFGQDIPPDASAGDRLLLLVRAMRENRMPALYIACAIVLVLVFVTGAFRFLQEYFAGTVGANISVTLSREMIANILGCSFRFFEKHPTGEIIARLTNDVFQVNRGLSSVFVKIVREPIRMVFFLGLALTADWQLTLVGLAVLPPVALVIVKVGQAFKTSVRRSLQKIASLAALGKEVFSGIAVVQGYCMEDYELRRTDAELDMLRRHLRRMVRADASIGPLVEVVLVSGVVGFVLFMGYRIEQGMDAGTLVRLIVPLAMILDPVRKLSAVNNMIMGSVASAERVFEFIDARSEVVERPDAIALPPLHQSLTFRGIGFSYDGETKVLDGIDLDIRKGEMVALVGFSGAGKSTLAKLVPRFYDPDEGAVLIDGVDIRDVTLRSLRDQIGLVTQETVLFNDSVRDNIAFGRDDIPDDRVRNAAEAAQAHAFIEALAEQYDTVIGESGGALSGGQRQRLAIARAIIKDPAILILDEATSSLDSESERAIQEAIDRFVVGRTTIVIAHRLSTVLRADRIVVLDRGRIAEQGAHAELLARDGIYRRLYRTQFSAGDNAADAPPEASPT